MIIPTIQKINSFLLKAKMNRCFDGIHSLQELQSSVENRFSACLEKQFSLLNLRFRMIFLRVVMVEKKNLKEWTLESLKDANSLKSGEISNKDTSSSSSSCKFTSHILKFI